MLANLSKASSFARISRLMSIVVLLFAAYAGSATAQSLNFDLPEPMTGNRVEGMLPKGKAIAHYYSFTAGPGELIVSFSFYGESAEFVGGIGGQLTDAYGRPFTNLDAKEKEYDKTSVTGDFDPSGKTLVGRYSIPRRQKLVLKVFTKTVGIDNEAPVRYRVRVDGGDGSSGGSMSSTAAPPAPKTTTAPASTAERNTTVTRSATRSVSPQRVTDLCTDEYKQCLRAAIITKTGAGVCIVRRANCMKTGRLI